MNSFLDLRIQVNLFHEAVNHSPLPWAGISYTLSMSPLNKLRALMRKDWMMQLESAALSAVVTYYRRGIMKPTAIRLLLPYDGKAKILGVASHGPQTPAFWRRMRRLTPSAKHYDTAPAKSTSRSGSDDHKTNSSHLSEVAYKRATYRM